MDVEPGRILVVDDNENNRDMLSRRLERRGHSIATAEDGERALAMIAESPFDVILLDIMMPGIDGFEVLRRLRPERDAAELPVIMVTAKDEREDVVQALKLGANDYVTKPLDFPVVLARVNTQLSLKRSVDTILDLERDLKARNEQLEVANERMSRDLAAAARLQQALLPSASPDVSGVEFAWKYIPCDELAGDILNVFKLDADHIGFYLLDVSGHGVPAALLSVTLSRMLTPVPRQSSLVRRQLDGDTAFEPASPARVAMELNQRFQLTQTSEQYFTLFYGVLHHKTGLLRYVCAGHPSPILVRRGQEPTKFDQRSFPIGWVPDFEYPEATLQLTPGDRLYVYSDGINESRKADGEMFEEAGILRCVDESRALPVSGTIDTLLATVKDWTGGTFDDDVSALGIEWNVPG